MTIAWIFYAVVHAIFAFDLWLDQTNRLTISEWVWALPVPPWVPFVTSLGLFNAVFFLLSPELAGFFLVAWLLGHWSR